MVSLKKIKTLTPAATHTHTHFAPLCQNPISFQAYRCFPLYLIGHIESLSPSDTSNGLPRSQSNLGPMQRDVWVSLMKGPPDGSSRVVEVCEEGRWRWRLSAGMDQGHSTPCLVRSPSAKC